MGGPGVTGVIWVGPIAVRFLLLNVVEGVGRVFVLTIRTFRVGRGSGVPIHDGLRQTLRSVQSACRGEPRRSPQQGWRGKPPSAGFHPPGAAGSTLRHATTTSGRTWQNAIGPAENTPLM